MSGDNYYKRLFLVLSNAKVRPILNGYFTISVVLFSSSQSSGQTAQLMKQYYTPADLKPMAGALQKSQAYFCTFTERLKSDGYSSFARDDWILENRL